MIRGCILILGSFLLAIILLFFTIYLPHYKEIASYLVVALLMTMIVGQSKASIFAKLIAWFIIWACIVYILIFLIGQVAIFH